MKGLDGAGHGGVDLAAELTQLVGLERGVGHEQGDGGVAGAGGDGAPVSLGQEALQLGGDRLTAAGDGVQVAPDDAAVATDDGADRVDDGEDGNADVADPPERAALAAGLGAVEGEAVADGDVAPRAAGAEREPAGDGGPEGGPTEGLVGVDGGVAADEVVDDAPGDEGELVPAGGAVAPGQQLGGDAAGGLEAI